MKKQWLIALLLAVVLLGCVALYQHFVVNRIADKGGMENTSVHIAMEQEE